MRTKNKHRALRGGGCWVVEKEGRRERSERWSREILIPRESGGRPVRAPCPMRGSRFPHAGYTVIAGAKQSKIVQFRAQSSILDMETLNLARAIHGQFVATRTYHGNIGQSSPLSVYVIEKLPGTTYIQARCINDGLSAEMSLET